MSVNDLKLPVLDILKDIEKDFSSSFKDDSVTSFVNSTSDAPPFFYPTGTVTLDMALGGGLAAGGCSEFFGPYSCGKSTTAYAAIAETQRLFPEKICVLIDLESSAFNSQDHMSLLGVDPERLIHIKKPNNGKPFYAEDAFERMEHLIRKHGENLSLVVVDSIGAVVSKSEGDNKNRWDRGQRVGGIAPVVSMMLRNIVDNGLLFESKAHILFLNQVRDDIGNMFNEFRSPGGKKLAHAVGIRVEISKVQSQKDYGNPDYKQGDPTQVMYLGQGIRYRVLKNKVGGKAGATAAVDFFYDSGLDIFGNYISMAEFIGLMQGSSWKSLINPTNGEVLAKFQGMRKWREALAEDPTLWNTLYTLVNYGIRGETPPPEMIVGGEVEDEGK